MRYIVLAAFLTLVIICGSGYSGFLIGIHYPDKPSNSESKEFWYPFGNTYLQLHGKDMGVQQVYLMGYNDGFYYRETSTYYKFNPKYNDLKNFYGWIYHDAWYCGREDNLRNGIFEPRPPCCPEEW